MNSILLLGIIGIVMYMQVASGQEITEEASKHAKEILCKEYYDLKYCEGQEVNNNNNTSTNSTNTSTNSTSTTIKQKPELECFGGLGNYFSEYHERTRCRLS